MTQERLRLVVTRRARADIEELLRWSVAKFGDAAALRYEDLIFQALLDLTLDPLRAGTKHLAEIRSNSAVYSYHLASSRDRAPGRLVRRPRHFILYQVSSATLEVVRVLCEERDLSRHISAVRENRRTVARIKAASCPGRG